MLELFSATLFTFGLALFLTEFISCTKLGSLFNSTQPITVTPLKFQAQLMPLTVHETSAFCCLSKNKDSDADHTTGI